MKAQELSATDPQQALAFLNEAVQIATKENDLALVAKCAHALIAAGKQMVDPKAAIGGARLLIVLKDLGAAEATAVAAEAARSKGDALGLIKAAQLGGRAGVPREALLNWGIEAAKLALLQPLPVVLGTAQELAEMPGAGDLPKELFDRLASRAVEQAQATMKPGDLTEAADLLVDLARAGMLPGEALVKASQLANAAAEAATSQKQWPAAIRAAGVLRDTGQGGTAERAASFALVAGKGAFAVQDELKTSGGMTDWETALSGAIEAVNLLAGLGPAAGPAALEMATLAGDRAFANGHTDLLLDCSSAVFGVKNPEATGGSAARWRPKPARPLWKEGDGDLVLTAGRQLLNFGQRAEPTDAVKMAAVAADFADKSRAAIDPVKNPEQIALAGSQMLEAAEILASNPGSQQQAIADAIQAAEVAAKEKDTGELLRAVVLLKNCGDSAGALNIAGFVSANEVALLQVATAAQDAEALLDHAETARKTADLLKEVGGDPGPLVNEVRVRGSEMIQGRAQRGEPALLAQPDVSDPKAAVLAAQAALERADNLVAALERIGMSLPEARKNVACWPSRPPSVPPWRKTPPPWSRRSASPSRTTRPRPPRWPSEPGSSASTP